MTPAIFFIVKRNYLYIGNSQEVSFDEKSFSIYNSKLLNKFNIALFNKDKETALNNDDMKIFSYQCAEITKFIKDINMIERETKLIENFIYEFSASTSIYHNFILISQENENLHNSIWGKDETKKLAKTIFDSFIKDLGSG